LLLEAQQRFCPPCDCGFENKAPERCDRAPVGHELGLAAEASAVINAHPSTDAIVDCRPSGMRRAFSANCAFCALDQRFQDGEEHFFGELCFLCTRR
jgi:hypothetical protein